MANKKKPVAKPDPLVVVPFNLNELHDAGLCTQLRDRQNGVSLAAHMALLGHEEQKIRELVAGLFANQHILIRRLIELLEQVEDPSVAHAVKVKEMLDTLTRKVEDLQDELNSHERTYVHEYSSNY